MNKDILNIKIQEFIDLNLKTELSKILLKGVPFKSIESNSIIEQIESKKRSEKKLPTWFNTPSIYYPNKLNIAQTSSEITAKYKANLVSGDSLIDLTGGFGVDAYFFSKRIKEVRHCEINSELFEIVKYNYNTLNTSNIECVNGDGIDVLKRLDQPFDWIYIDPSRRDESQQKVFLLSDCTPNIKTFQNLFLKYARQVMIKTSPLLDLKATNSDLNNVKEIHVVAVNNEVKELLWILERSYSGSVSIKTVNLLKDHMQTFSFCFQDEAEASVEYSEPLAYLYEPNLAILKSGAFNLVSQQLQLLKLHKHSHLYTSKRLITFPGRCFKIEQILAFNKKRFAKEGIKKANITTRNFPLSVHDLRKKLNIKDGGEIYLFFTTNSEDEKIIIMCKKI